MTLQIYFNFYSKAEDSRSILYKVAGYYNGRINFLLNKDFEMIDFIDENT